MTEQSICCVNAAVYYYEDSKWQPGDGGISVVYVYHNPSNNAYRVVAMSASDNQVVINSAIFKDLKYQHLSDTFHTWADTKFSYGLNFASLQDATTFSDTMNQTVQKLVESAGSAPEEAEATPEATPEAAPEPEPEQKEEPAAVGGAAGAAPGGAAAPAGGRGRAAGRGRGADAGGAGAGAGGAGRAGAGRAGGRGGGRGASSTTGGGGGGEVKDLDSLKEVLIAAFREQLEIAKEDILRAVDEKIAASK